jgi:hypothetical protein
MIGLNGLSARNEFSGSSELSQQFSGMVTYGINLHIVALILVAMGIVFLCNNSAALTLKFTKLIGSKK